MLPSSNLIKGHIMGLYLLKGYVDTWLMSSTHGVFNFPCQRISGRHHVRDWSCWIATFFLDSQTLQWIRGWNESLSNHANASLLPWRREKSYIKDRTHCQTKQHKLEQSISQKQLDLNSVSIDWCLPMSFTNLDLKQLGTSSWQSDHYLAFTCVSLFPFSCLESQNVPDGSRREIKVFKRLQVIWFCLITRLFTNIVVPPSVIELYVKIFLFMCL